MIENLRTFIYSKKLVRLDAELVSYFEDIGIMLVCAPHKRITNGISSFDCIVSGRLANRSTDPQVLAGALPSALG